MRLELRLPTAEPDEISEPSVCCYPKYGGRHFRLYQVVGKPVRDTVYEVVTARQNILPIKASAVGYAARHKASP